MSLFSQIENKLEEMGIKYTIRNDEIVCSCFLGTHQDNTPSMNINPEKDVYYCFSCKGSGKASSLLKIKVDQESERFSKYKAYLSFLEEAQTRVEEPVGVDKHMLPPKDSSVVVSDWRGVSKTTFGKLGVYYCSIGRYRGRLILPSIDPATKEVIGFDARVVDDINSITGVVPSAKDAKYLRSSIMKTKTSLWIPKEFPWFSSTNVVLTEGVFDAISLLELGYNAVANYGLVSFSPEKAALLYSAGVTSVTVGFDLDPPGIKESPKIAEQIKETGLKISKPLPFVSKMFELGLKDYNEYLIYMKGQK